MSELPELLNIKEYEELLEKKEIDEDSYHGHRLWGFGGEHLRKENLSINTQVFIRKDLLSKNSFAVKLNRRAFSVDKELRIMLILAQNEIKNKGLVVFKFNGNSYLVRTLNNLSNLYNSLKIQRLDDIITRVSPFAELLPAYPKDDITGILQQIKEIDTESIEIVFPRQTRIFVGVSQMLRSSKKRKFLNVSYRLFFVMNMFIRHFITDFDKELISFRKFKKTIGRPSEHDKKMKYGKIYCDTYAIACRTQKDHKAKAFALITTKKAYEVELIQNNSDERNKKMHPVKDRTFRDWGSYYLEHHVVKAEMP